MQSVLSPIVGRLSDILDRKWLVSIPPLIAFIGAIVSATANSMSTLIGGGILIGVTLSTLSILQAIPSEILPLKYRAVANGAGFLGSAVGGIVGSLGAGKVTAMSASGWRCIFWIQAALHGATFISMVLFYHPSRRSDYPRLKLKEYLWAIDPIGSGLFMLGTTLTLLALGWAPSHTWRDAQVIAPLCIGLVLLLAFTLYGIFVMCPSNLLANRVQNGRGEQMGYSRMLSFRSLQISCLQSSRSRSKGGSSMALSTVLYRRLYSILDSKTTLGRSRLGNSPPQSPLSEPALRSYCTQLDTRT